jgi:hypothetical protein
MSRLLDQVREAVRTRHYSIRTEEAYLRWIREYILFFHKRHHGSRQGFRTRVGKIANNGV